MSFNGGWGLIYNTLSYVLVFPQSYILIFFFFCMFFSLITMDSKSLEIFL